MYIDDKCLNVIPISLWAGILSLATNVVVDTIIKEQTSIHTKYKL